MRYGTDRLKAQDMQGGGKMGFFLTKVEPSHVTVAGQDVQLLFTMHAAARMEQELEDDYPALVMEMLRLPKDGGDKLAPPMRLERQAKVVRILMEECGQDVRDEDILTLHMQDFAALARAAQEEILRKSPKSAKKNGPRPAT